jgi:hypothetical protein
MQRFFNPELSLDKLLDKIREMIRVLPDNMAEIVKFACLTGLRPSEACESVRLLKGFPNSGNATYYNRQQQALEHFRFPDIFLRPTKKSLSVLYHA